jgi:hypothetical protein
MAFSVSFVVGITGLVGYCDKTTRNNTFLTIAIVGITVLIFTLIPLIAGRQSLSDMSRDTMKLVASGEYKIDRDCWGKETEKIDNSVLIYKDFWKSNIVEADGTHYQRTNVPKLIEGKKYSLYRKETLLHYNLIIHCDE